MEEQNGESEKEAECTASVGRGPSSGRVSMTTMHYRLWVQADRFYEREREQWREGKRSGEERENGCGERKRRELERWEGATGKEEGKKEEWQREGKR